MKKLSRLLGRLIPPYARGPLLAVLLFNFVGYYVPKLTEVHRHLHLVSSAFDDALPRVPVFIFIYVLAYLQWAVGFIVIARDSRARCMRVLSGELIAKAVSLVIFLLYPMTFDRPGISVTGPCSWLLAFMYRLDTPTNLCPSLHCLESWLCFRGAIGLRRMGPAYTRLQLCFTLLVFAAVLLVKQHLWYDILGGVAVAELGLLLSRALHADRWMERLDFSGKGRPADAGN